MPTYDFKCKDCEHEFSAFCKVSEKDDQICPKCGSNMIKTIFKSFNSFNGAGSKSPNMPLPPPSGFG